MPRPKSENPTQSRSGHPNQCHGIVRNDDQGRKGKRCEQYAAQGSKFCKFHKGTCHEGRTTRYAETILKPQIEKLLDDPNIKSIREEIALSRALLQKIVIKVEDEHGGDLTVYANQIHGLTEAITKSVERLVKIEDGLRLHLSFDELSSLVSVIIGVIKVKVPDTSAQIAIAQAIEQALPFSLESGMAHAALLADHSYAGGSQNGGQKR